MSEELEHVKAGDIVTFELANLLREYSKPGKILTADMINSAIDKYNAQLKGE